MNLERLTEATVIMLLAFIGGGAVATLNKPTSQDSPAAETTAATVPQGASLAPAADPPAAAGVLEPIPPAPAESQLPSEAAGVRQQSDCAACAPAAARYVYQSQPARAYPLRPWKRRGR